MSRTDEEFSGQAKEHSGWVIPLTVFFVTAGFSALMLAYYFAPTPPGLGAEFPVPTDSTQAVVLQVGALHLHVPANYVLLASSRRGGSLKRLAMAATLPALDGYSLTTAQDFTSNAPDSPAVYFALDTSEHPLPEQDRLNRVYLGQTESANASPGPYGLKAYRFRADSGYHDQDLFVGQIDTGMIILLCNKPGLDTPSPNCLRDTLIDGGIGFSYRFKRAQLAQWKTIDSGLRALIAKFQASSSEAASH